MSLSRGGIEGTALALMHMDSPATGNESTRFSTSNAPVPLPKFQEFIGAIDVKQSPDFHSAPSSWTPPIIPRTVYSFPQQSPPQLHHGAMDFQAPLPQTNSPIAPFLPWGDPSHTLPVRQHTPPEFRPGAMESQAPSPQINSPTASFSSWGDPSHPLPVRQYTPPVMQAQTSIFCCYAGPQMLGGPQITHGSRSLYRQSEHQLIALDTDQGPVQIPVNVQAGSKLADERRARNACASARIRQRRKEKEKKTIGDLESEICDLKEKERDTVGRLESEICKLKEKERETVGKLESEIHDLKEKCKYYCLERDYYHGLVYSMNPQAS